LDDASAYAFDLPEERIARTPAERREDAKLLLLGPAGELQDRTFAAFPEQLHPGDVLVLNETRVIPARLRFARPGGGAGELLLLRPADRDAFADAFGNAAPLLFVGLALGCWSAWKWMQKP